MNDNGSYEDRRKHPRIPVSVGFKCNVKGTYPEFFYTTVIYNYSEGGICIKWNFCETCTGYTQGKIHPECIFSPYDYHKEDAEELVFHVELDNYEFDFNFKGKAVYTLQEEDGSEKVGIVFTDISDDTLQSMKEIF
jgi:hypothetical protein